MESLLDKADKGFKQDRRQTDNQADHDAEYKHLVPFGQMGYRIQLWHIHTKITIFVKSVTLRNC